jgi:peptide/nickel transport system permease protein
MATVAPAEGKIRRSALASGFKTLRRSKMMTLGLGIMTLVCLVALLAPWIATHDPLFLNPMIRLQAPGPDHLLGTDDVGRDVFSRVVWGSRVSLQVGALVVLSSNLIGTAIGLVSGYYPKVDRVVMRVMDGLMAFPTTLLAIAMMAALGARMSNVIIALSIVYIPRVARVVRGVVLTVRELAYVEAAVAIGAPAWKIMLFHILPNCLDPIIVQSSFIFAQSVLSEAALSYLGVGIPPWIPSWGNIMTGGRLFINAAPWMTWFPGLAIIICVLGLNLFGDGLRDLVDPRLRGVL